MLFKRRKPAGWIEIFRISLWPRHSWRRSWQYVSKRILRLSASPQSVALGVAAGAFASFTPFVGLHFVLAFIIAWAIRGNIIASALGTFVGNPITFPIIWIVTHELGSFLVANTNTTAGTNAIATDMTQIVGLFIHMQWNEATQAFKMIWNPLIYPMLIGGTILGFVVAILLYFPVKDACQAFQTQRRNQIDLLKKMREKAQKKKRKKKKVKRQATG